MMIQIIFAIMLGLTIVLAILSPIVSAQETMSVEDINYIQGLTSTRKNLQLASIINSYRHPPSKKEICYFKTAPYFLETDIEKAIHLCSQITNKPLKQKCIITLAKVGGRKNIFVCKQAEVSSDLLNLCNRHFAPEIVLYDPDAALYACNSIKGDSVVPGSIRNACLKDISVRMAPVDTEKALVFCNNGKEPITVPYQICAREIAKHMAENHEVDNACSLCSKVLEGFRNSCYYEIVKTMPGDLEKIDEICTQDLRKTQTGQKVGEDYCKMQVLNMLMETDFSLAEELCEKYMSEEGMRGNCFNKLSSYVIGNDIDRALYFCNRIQKPYYKNECMRRIESKKSKLLSVDEILLTCNDTACFDKAAQSICVHDPDGSFEICGQIGDMEERALCHARVISIIAKNITYQYSLKHLEATINTSWVNSKYADVLEPYMDAVQDICPEHDYCELSDKGNMILDICHKLPQDSKDIYLRDIKNFCYFVASSGIAFNDVEQALEECENINKNNNIELCKINVAKMYATKYACHECDTKAIYERAIAICDSLSEDNRVLCYAAISPIIAKANYSMLAGICSYEPVKKDQFGILFYVTNISNNPISDVVVSVYDIREYCITDNEGLCYMDELEEGKRFMVQKSGYVSYTGRIVPSEKINVVLEAHSFPEDLTERPVRIVGKPKFFEWLLGLVDDFSKFNFDFLFRK